MNIKQNSSGIFLALTALEEFWDIARPILFLGPWCKDYKKRNVWKNIHGVELPSKELSHINSYETYQYAAVCYENLFPKIANWLNELHETKRSLKYWRLLVGPFLFWYTQIVYERFMYLEAAYHRYPDLETYGLSHDSFLTTINTTEFVNFARASDTWNLQLFTQLLELIEKPIFYKTATWENELNERNINFCNFSYKFRTKCLFSVFRLINKLKQSQAAGIIDGFSRRDIVKLMLSSKFRILPIFPTASLNRCQTLSRLDLIKKVDIKKRNQLLNIVANDVLSKLVIHTLPINMPINFIEGYQDEVAMSKKYFPYVSKVIMLESCASYDQYKFWIGDQLEKGSKLVGYQHGGCYGMQKASSAEFLERYVSDFFLSWGWNSNKVIPAPAFRAPRSIIQYYRKKNNTESKEFLWITTLSCLRYQLSAHDWIAPSKAYFEYQRRFLSALDKKNHSDVCMRIDPSNTNIEEIRENFPKINVYLPKDRNSFFPHLARAKIAIVDNPSAPFLHTLSLNVPTILFWDRNYWVFRDAAKPYLDALEQVGIYYHCPEAAAEMLNKIADDPYSWWFDEPVQSVRQKFCDNFVKTSPDYIHEWKNILLSLSKSN